MHKQGIKDYNILFVRLNFFHRIDSYSSVLLREEGKISLNMISDVGFFFFFFFRHKHANKRFRTIRFVATCDWHDTTCGVNFSGFVFNKDYGTVYYRSHEITCVKFWQLFKLLILHQTNKTKFLFEWRLRKEARTGARF